MTFKIIAGLLSVLAVASGTSDAFAICEEALVTASIDSRTNVAKDWRLVKEVSEIEYDKRTTNASADFEIFDVPVGSSYENFQERAKNWSEKYNEELSTREINQLMWSGLDPKGAEAYATCLSADLFSKEGLHLAIVKATPEQVTLKVKLTVPRETATVALQWETSADLATQLPKELVINDEPQNIYVERPASPTQLSVNARGYSSEVVEIGPLPGPPPRVIEYRISGVGTDRTTFDREPILPLPGTTYNVTVDQLANGAVCATGSLSDTKNHFGQGVTSTDQVRDDSLTFFRGASQTKGGQLQIFLGPATSGACAK